MGSSFGEFVETLGNGVRNGKDVKAYIPGGASAPWFRGDQLDIKMTIDDVANNQDKYKIIKVHVSIHDFVNNQKKCQIIEIHM